ncbi:MAG: hypothetical protein IJI54_14370 [Kiritimatiellae bacterium]|nr:hypothetical protein [Kiritimatiellia bacterium]
MMAVAGAMFAALALRWAWQVVVGEARRHGVAKVALLLLMSAPLVFWAGGKGGGPRSPEPTPEPGPETPAPVVPRREAAPGLHRYFAPSNFVADLNIFTRPTNAVTPSLWMRHSVCDDFQEALPDYIAGACGVVTTQPWGIDTPQLIKDCYETYAPFYATNSLIRGLGEFWAITNENSKTFVWKNLAYNRNPSNLVSFAATVYDWGDFEFTYGNIPEGGFSSFVKIGAEALDMTQYAASGQTVRVEKNLEQDTEWWLENYPEICYTNATGELVFDYDTNEWCFVEFVYENQEFRHAQEEFRRAKEEYERLFDALSNDVVRIEKYTVETYPDSARDDSHSGDSHGNIEHLEDAFIEMQVQKYGWNIGLEGTAIDSLPGGLSANDVTYLGRMNDPNTNIMHWVIKDYSRVVEKIGQSPDKEDFGLTPLGYLPKYRAFSPPPGLVNVRFVFQVPKKSVVRFFVDNRDKPFDTWAEFKKTGGSRIVPCHSGYVYHVTASRGFEELYNPPVSPLHGDDDMLNWWDSNQRHVVFFHRKLSMNIAGATFTNANFATARAVMTPPVTNGVYAWEASNNIRVAPIGNGQWAGLFLDDGAGGFVRCVWNNGKHDVWRLCTTAEVSVASCAYTNLTKFIDLRASPTLAVFEDSHLGTNGQPVMAGVTTSSLVCSYHGNRAGTLELSQVSGTAVALSEGDVPITMPFSWGVNGGGGDPDRVFNVSNLHVGEVAEFRLKFTNDLVPQGIDCLASIRAVTLVVQAERTWPMERYRHVFGPREVVALAAPDATGNVSWQFGTGTTNINPFSYLLPMTPGSVFLTLTVDGSSYSFPISVVGPSSVIGTNAVVMTDEDWIATGFAPLSIGEVGAGERIDLKFEPDYVSFVGLKTMEGFSQVYNKTGYFEQYNMSNVVHNAANGAGVVTTVGEENGVGRDRAGFAFTNAELPPPWADGGFEFRIPFYWWVDGSSQTNEVSTNVQSFTLFANGDAETSKFGWTVHRGTNGVSTVSSPNSPPNPD